MKLYRVTITDSQFIAGPAFNEAENSYEGTLQECEQWCKANQAKYVVWCEIDAKTNKPKLHNVHTGGNDYNNVVIYNHKKYEG